MNDFITKYLSQFNVEAIVTASLNKIFSLILLFITFYILKKLAKASVKKVLVPSLKISNREQGRQKTIFYLTKHFGRLLRFARNDGHCEEAIWIYFNIKREKGLLSPFF